MQENEFEKQMRLKMDELKIHPSASVWQSVEANIAKARRRRHRVWILLPVLLISLFTGGYLFQQSGMHLKQVSTDALLKNEIFKTTLPANTSSISDRDSNKDSIKKHRKITSSPPPKETIFSSINRNHNFTAPKWPSNHLSTEANNIYPQMSATKPSAGYHSKKGKEKSDNKASVNKEFTAIETPDNADFIFTGTQNAVKERSEESGRKAPAIETVDKADSIFTGMQNVVESSLELVQNIAGLNTVTTWHSSSTNIITDSVQKNIQLNNTSVVSKQPLATKQNKPQNIWKWGLTLSAGVSDISYSFLGSDFLGSGTAERKLFALTADANSNSLPGVDSLSPKKPYLIKPSLAFNVGLFVTKNISKNTSLTVGINYKPFSTTNKVGKKIDSANSYQIQYPVNQYKSHYHFIEFPVSYSVKVTRLKKFPLVFNAGISVSQLIASNALQFNDTSGIYYYDNALFNKTQIGFTAGVYLSNNKNNMLIGPDIFYATTKISNKGLYKDAHFTHLGVSFKYLFGK